MKRLFLASSINLVAHDIAKRLDKPAQGLKLLFVTTASEVEEGDRQWLADDREALVKAGFEVEDYTFTGKTAEQVKAKLGEVDVLHMEGGTATYLLEKIHQSGCYQAILDFVDSGKVYIGSSAGSIAAGPDIPPYYLDDSQKAKYFNGHTGLGLVGFVALPHWGNELFRERYLGRRMEQAYVPGYKLILLNDWQYVRVEGEMYRIEAVRH